MKTKICSKCKRELDITEFYKHKGYKNGLNSICKECKKTEIRNWRKQNKESLAKKWRKYYLKHKKEILEKQKKYIKKHREKYLEYHRLYWNRHPEIRKMPRGLTYISWRSAKERCYNEKSDSYINYGGRGIKICDRWLGKEGFNNFIKDMGYRPSKDYEIHRLDNDYNYCPENCEWITKIKHKYIHRNWGKKIND